MKNKKIYLILLISNILFFGVFFFLLWTELTFYNNGWFSVWVLIFIPLILIYSIIYGILSYKHTRDLYYPHLILWFFFALLPFSQSILSSGSHDLLSSVIYSFAISIFMSSFFIPFSFIPSLITKFIIDKKEKASERQEH